MVVVYDIAQVVATAVVCFAHAHRVVGEVDIAVVAEDCTETCALVLTTCLAVGVVILHLGILNALFWVPLVRCCVDSVPSPGGVAKVEQSGEVQQQQRTGALSGKAEVGQGSRGNRPHINVDTVALIGQGRGSYPWH